MTYIPCTPCGHLQWVPPLCQTIFRVPLGLVKKQKLHKRRKICSMSTWDIDMNGQTSNGTESGICATTQASKEREKGCPAKYDSRSIMNGILWIAGNGVLWRELPERYGKRQAVYAGFRLWTQRGILEHIFALHEAADMEHLSIDSICCKVHQSTNCEKKRNIRQLACQKVAEIRKSIPCRWVWESCVLFAQQWQRP